MANRMRVQYRPLLFVLIGAALDRMAFAVRWFAFLRQERRNRNPTTYKYQVLDCLHSLLYPYPGGRENIIKDYPGILDVIRIKFTEGGKPERTALDMAGSILAKLVEPLTADDRSNIVLQLGHLDLRMLKTMMNDARDGKSRELTDTVVQRAAEDRFHILMFGNALVVAKTHFDNGEVDQSAYDTFTSEVFGALAGKPFEQRSTERILNALDNLMPKVSRATK